jgi:hypothetical protein
LWFLPIVLFPECICHIHYLNTKITYVENNPTVYNQIYLYRGFTYSFVFKEDTLSPSGQHPFIISDLNREDYRSNSSVNNEYGIYIPGTELWEENTITITIDEHTPDTLYYFCTLHAGMGGTITVNNDIVDVENPDIFVEQVTQDPQNKELAIFSNEFGPYEQKSPYIRIIESSNLISGANKIYLKSEYNLLLSMFSSGVSIIYSDFMQKAKREERLPMTLKEVYEKVSKNPLPPSQKYLVFELIVIDATTDEEVEIPYLRVRL